MLVTSLRGIIQRFWSQGFHDEMPLFQQSISKDTLEGMTIKNDAPISVFRLNSHRSSESCPSFKFRVPSSEFRVGFPYCQVDILKACFRKQRSRNRYQKRRALRSSQQKSHQRNREQNTDSAYDSVAYYLVRTTFPEPRAKSEEFNNAQFQAS